MFSPLFSTSFQVILNSACFWHPLNTELIVLQRELHQVGVTSIPISSTGIATSETVTVKATSLQMQSEDFFPTTLLPCHIIFTSEAEHGQNCTLQHI